MDDKRSLKDVLFSFKGRIIAAALVLAWSLVYVWALIYYQNPIFWGFLLPFGLGAWGIWDAVKRKRAGEFDGGSKTN
ncbi:Uncharacterised protein [Mycobacteroides abscessus subsp. massiliense]|uniref:hypothetical protein n=1 Tax=Mycobacteroides abscessus TaxID=36809 RepID=UPI0009A68DF8|nr:hypothetical protein [Mycobacteroides abscessus]SLI18391.1 Uncharacterised protein [Mycobacteroides abscessus subsp. massiliense]SLI99065.1 Uncharacterised protein [Mycobacteroides abscessus subsp. massiliense]